MTWTASMQVDGLTLTAYAHHLLPLRDFAARLLADDPCWRRKPHFRLANDPSRQYVLRRDHRTINSVVFVTTPSLGNA